MMFQTLSAMLSAARQKSILETNSSFCSGTVWRGYAQAYRITELEFALNKVECRALITATRHKHSDYIGMIQARWSDGRQS